MKREPKELAAWLQGACFIAKSRQDMISSLAGRLEKLPCHANEKWRKFNHHIRVVYSYAFCVEYISIGNLQALFFIGKVINISNFLLNPASYNILDLHRKTQCGVLWFAQKLNVDQYQTFDVFLHIVLGLFQTCHRTTKNRWHVVLLPYILLSIRRIVS